MAATPPPIIRGLPLPPDPNDRSTFNARAYPWSLAQADLADDVGAVADNVYDNALDAAQSANDSGTAKGLAELAQDLADAAALHAQQQAALASQAAMANASTWQPDGDYTQNQIVWLDDTHGLLFRALQSHSGRVTPPDEDGTYWALVGAATIAAPVFSALTSLSITRADDRVSGGSFVHNGAAGTFALTRTDGRIAASSITSGGRTQTSTYARDGRGRITSVSTTG